MVEYLSFQDAAGVLKCSTSKVRQLVMEDRQLRATRISLLGIVVTSTANDELLLYHFDMNYHLSDEGQITTDIYELQPNGETEITQGIECGFLRIERADLNTYIATSGRDIDTGSVSSNKVTAAWPWGSHHTERLGHLEAAARRFWVNYEPSDHGTAPTNAVVSEWLQKERKATLTMADSIATMLRPDNLPTGPRK